MITIKDIEINDSQLKAYQRMKLNSYSNKDKDFSNRIKFIIEEYVENDVPKWHEYKDLKEALCFAYVLKMINKLYAFTIMHNKKCISSDALNLFDNVNIETMYNKIEKLENEKNDFNEFLKKYNAVETYKEFLKEKYNK